MRLNSFDIFRGVTILLIVAVHTRVPEIDAPLLWASISNGSIFFVFISGFFYGYLKNYNLNFYSFFTKKVKTIFLPYVLISIPIIIWRLIETESGTITKDTLSYILSGSHADSLWFMPFILLFFCISNISRFFIGIDKNIQMIIISVLSIYPIVELRSDISSTNTITAFENLLYFIPVYLFGISASKNLRIFTDNKKYGYISLVLSLGFVYLDSNINQPVDYSYINKIFVIATFLFFHDEVNKFKCRYLSMSAKHSFNIYFLHVYVITLMDISGLIDFIVHNSSTYISIPLITLMCTTGSVSIAIVARLIMPVKYKYVIGN